MSKKNIQRFYKSRQYKTDIILLINKFTSNIPQIVHTINNPNLPIGTLIEEIPTDIGRSYAGYKRGGVIEGAEKLRKELMSAIVWMFGINAFNSLGTKICENVLNIPMNMDYSNSKDGNDAIRNSVEFLVGKVKETQFDTSELAKYKDKYKGMDPELLIKRIRGAKQVTSILAVAMNCIAMGILLPKINQAITRKKIQKMEQEKLQKAQNENNDKGKDIRFKGDLLNSFVFNVENNNTFRLIVPDVPMIAGRVGTSRNIFEGIENFVIDGGSIYFYNFSAGHIQSALRKATKTPNIPPIIADILSRADEKTLSEIFTNLNAKSNVEFLADITTNRELIHEIFDKGTYGKIGKINRFVKSDDLKDITDGVISFLNTVKSAQTSEQPLFKNGSINIDLIKKVAYKTNMKNAAFLAIGLGISIFGLAVAIPKLAFWITRKLTGKNEFSGTMVVDKKENS